MKVHFITGSMFSGKSREVIDYLISCELDKKRVLCFKPKLDTRDFLCIKSRDRKRTFSCMGIQQMKSPLHEELVYDVFPQLKREELLQYHSIVVDEAQFLTEAGIKFLVDLSKAYELPLVLSGLSYDFRGELFPSIRFLLDTYGESLEITELLATCFSCGEDTASNSCRVKNNEIVHEGALTEIGDSESYIALCDSCLSKKIERKGE